MTKREVVKRLTGGPKPPTTETASAFAPVNIALCKYWGKRDEELNLPVTSSLSISLGAKGTELDVSTRGQADEVSVNGERLAAETPAARRLSAYLDLFRPSPGAGFVIRTRSNVPMAAGLASSAALFAALVKALKDLFGWDLDGRALSILARLGSGSASRSLFDGFVEWHVGAAEDGMDSFAEPLETSWPELRLGVVTVSEAPKAIGSREAMKRTRETCALYEAWPLKAANDLVRLKEAIRDRDFAALGRTAESNALAMHATMIATWPPVLYWKPETIRTLERVWALRAGGMPLYLTMDAGPNVKLLFEERETEEVRDAFPGVEVIDPFAGREPRAG